MSEYDEQVAVINWFRIQFPKLILFAIPNGEYRHIATAIKLKKSGVVAGVSDLFLMKPSGKYHGLFIEMKQKKGIVSDKQKYFLEQAELQGYATCVCYSFEEAQSKITKYLQNVEQ